MSSDSAKTLREGYSTGACATAVIMAAWASLLGFQPESPAETEAALSRAVLFPDGKLRDISLLHVSPGYAALVKDGGDDPDCTHGAEIYARVRQAKPEEAGEHDYTLETGNGLLILRAVEGIGLCTRPGLDCDRGKWAINTGPRRMIAENMSRFWMDSGCFLAEIGVKNGEKLAQKTLNSQLGVLNGISILGTTGIVRPFSHEAYIETIRICMRSARLEGFDEIVLCTGGRTQSAARRHLPHIPAASFVCMGDFIADSLKSAQEQEMQQVTVACMPGKLCKYAAGFDNTHAHKVKQDIQLFLSTLEKFHSPATEERQSLLSCASVRQALEHTPDDCRLPIYADLCRQAFDQFSLRAPRVRFRFLICDFDGSLLLDITSPAPLPPCLP